MYCKRVRLKNFRNIEECDIEFCDGVNIIIGENAQGKTNLLEAIFYASVVRSFRASNTGEMIRFGERRAEISVDYQLSSRERSDNVNIEIFSDKKKNVKKNNLKIDKLSEIIGSFRSVLFCPEHLSLIKDGPVERRSYLDIAISRISPKYIHALQRYNYFLKQRNSLIRAAYDNREVFNSTVDLWSESLAKEAAVISKERYIFLCRAAKIVEYCFEEMTGEREKVEIIYRGSLGTLCDGYLDENECEKKIRRAFIRLTR